MACKFDENCSEDEKINIQSLSPKKISKGSSFVSSQRALAAYSSVHTLLNLIQCLLKHFIIRQDALKRFSSHCPSGRAQCS